MTTTASVVRRNRVRFRLLTFAALLVAVSASYAQFPAAPQLVSPPQNADDQPLDPTLLWRSVAGSTGYRAQVSVTPDFSGTLVHDALHADTTTGVGPLQNGVTYYWRVRAMAFLIAGNWSGSRQFTTDQVPPAAPTLVSPADGATGLPTNPTLVWNAGARAETYRVQVSTGASFNNPVVDEEDITATSYPLSGLNNGTTYRWRVRAFNSAGQSPWSAVRLFTTLVPAPGIPVLMSPASGSTGQPATVALDWQNVSGATSYWWQISTGPTFATIASQDTVGNSSGQAAGLTMNTTYYWRVAAISAGGAGGWSVVWNFTTAATAPGAATLSAPANGATNVSTSPTLSWLAQTGVTSYELQVSGAASFSTTVYSSTGITTTSQAVGPLNQGTVYYWRVRAYNVDVPGGWSGVWSFTTASSAPNAPTLSSPANGATNVVTSPALAWAAQTGATSYELQVSVSSTFGTTVYASSGIAGTTQTVGPLNQGTVYYWRVRAYNLQAAGNWSSVWSFTTASSAPTAVTLSSPANGASNVATSPTLSWAAKAGATSYELQVSTVSSFATTVYASGGISGTSETVGPLSQGTVYYWRVRAFIALLPGAWSGVWSFSTTAAVPAAVLLSSPPSGSSNLSPSPVLQWNATAGAVRYHLQLSSQSDFATLTLNDTGITGTTRQVGPLATGSPWYWRVRASNGTQWGGFSTVWIFSVAGASAPTVSTTPVTGVSPSAATLNGLVGPNGQSVSVIFQYGPTTAYGDSIAATPPLVSGTSSVAVTATVAGLQPGTTYHYRLRASGSGGTAFSPDRTFSTSPPGYPGTYAVQATIPFPQRATPADYQPTDYRIVGIPGAIDQPIAGFLGGTNNVDWQAYWDNGDPNGGFVAWNGSEVFRFTAGRAFWIVRKGDLAVSATVPTAPLNDAGEVEIPLHSGWNLITNPFTEGIDWDGVRDANGVAEPIYAFDGGFSQSNELMPYGGYYFFNGSGLGALRIPYALTTAPPASPAARPDDASWRIGIALQSDGGVDRSAEVGVSPDAAEGRDRYEFHKPGGRGGAPAVVFRRDAWDGADHLFAADVRPALDTLTRWDFDVASRGGDRLRLVFTGASAVPAGLQVALIDPGSGRHADLRTDSAYEFVAEKGITRFSILVGCRSCVSNEVGALAVPSGYALGNNYPNPFNPETVVPVDIPAAGPVAIRIYNLLGEEIATMFDGTLEPGRYRFLWRGEDDRGLPVPGGTYYCRLTTAGGVSQVRSMVLIR